jgi:hypothetical protein
MRYKIKAPNHEVYRAILGLLDEEKVQVPLTSERRHLIAALDVSQRLLTEIAARGASVTEDFQYDLEKTAATAKPTA